MSDNLWIEIDGERVYFTEAEVKKLLEHPKFKEGLNKAYEMAPEMREWPVEKLLKFIQTGGNNDE